MHGKKKTLNACPACLLPEYKNSGLEQVAMTAQVSLFPNFMGRVSRCTFLSLSLSLACSPLRSTPRHSSYVSPSYFACACMANRDLRRDAERKTWASWRESRDKLFCGDLRDLVESVVLRELAKSVPRSAKKKATMLGLLAAFICCPPARQTHQHRRIPHRRRHELQHHAGVSSTSTSTSTD